MLPKAALGLLIDRGTLASLGDEALLSLYLEGDAGERELAFAAIVARHEAWVHRVCLSICRNAADAQDASQAVFVFLARKADTIRDRERLAGWLARIAKRVAGKSQARRRRRSLLECEAAIARFSRDAGRQDSAVHDALLEEIELLPDHYRLPVRLCCIEGLSYQAAAERLDCPIGTIKGRLSRAKARLRQSLRRRSAHAGPPGLAAFASPANVVISRASKSSVAMFEETLLGATRMMTAFRCVMAGSACLIVLGAVACFAFVRAQEPTAPSSAKASAEVLGDDLFTRVYAAADVIAAPVSDREGQAADTSKELGALADLLAMTMDFDTRKTAEGAIKRAPASPNDRESAQGFMIAPFQLNHSIIVRAGRSEHQKIDRAFKLLRALRHQDDLARAAKPAVQGAEAAPDVREILRRLDAIERRLGESPKEGSAAARPRTPEAAGDPAMDAEETRSSTHKKYDVKSLLFR